MSITDTFKRLNTYETRLTVIKQKPIHSAEDFANMEFYEREIEEMKAEIAVQDLIYEMDLNEQKPNVLTTDCSQIVLEMFRDERVVSIDTVWSWRSMKFLFKLEFYYKKRF